jgi:hypothetical protein
LLGNSRHCAPVPNSRKIPLSTARGPCHGRPRPSVRRLGRFDQLPVGIAQFPSSSHAS